MDKNDFMRLALLEAEKAFLDGEVPVGAVIVSCLLYTSDAADEL